MNTPRWVRRAITTAGGRNSYNEPNYRVVWSNTRLTTVGGKWDVYLVDGIETPVPYGQPTAGVFLRTVVGYQELPKYWSYPNRWIIEKWLPPEAYGGLQAWWLQTAEQIDGQFIATEGPFPERGDYEFSSVIQTPEGDFVDLTTAVVERAVKLVEAGHSFTRSQKRAALDRREEKKRKDELSQNEAIVADAMLPFHGANGQIVLTDDLQPLKKHIN